MKPFKSFWKIVKSSFTILVLTSCASLPETTKSIQLSKMRLTTPRDVYEFYCSKNKQKNPMTLKIEYISPRVPKGMPIDHASENLKQMKYMEKCLIRKTFFLLSNQATEQLWRDTAFLSPIGYDQTIGAAKAVEANFVNYSNYAMDITPLPLILRFKDSDKTVAFHDKAEIRDNTIRSEFINEGSMFAQELNLLTSDYTMLEPEAFQHERYSGNSECRNGTTGPDSIYEDGPYAEGEAIAVKDNGEASISQAIEFKRNIWERYLIRHTNIKKAVSNDPQITNYDLALDLSDFCRYGRSIESLTSR